MTARRWTILILLALVGYGALAILFPRFDPSAKWNVQLDRDQAIAKAQEIAAQQGVEVRGWQESVQATRDRNHESYLREHSSNAFEMDLLSPIKTLVVFRDPRTNQILRLNFSAQGQLLSFTRLGFKQEDASKSGPPDRDVAAKAVANVLGNNFSRFSFKTDAEPEKGSRTLIWNYLSGTEQDLKFEAEATVTGSTLTYLAIKPTLPEEYQLELRRRDVASFAILGALGFVVNALAVIAALLVYFLSLNRKEVDHLGSLFFFLLTLALMLLDNGWTGLLDQFKRGDNFRGITNPAVLTVLPYVLYILVCLTFTLLLTAYWAAGEAVSAKFQTGRLAVFAATIRGRIFTRPVANNLAAGFLTGGFIAAIPYLFAAIFGLSTTPSDLASIHDLFTTSLPGIAAIVSATISGYLYHLILLFAFLAGALGAYVQKKWASYSLLSLAGLVFLFDLNPNQTTSFLLKVGVTFAVFLVFALLYKYFDLLAVLAANAAAVLSIKTFGLLSQPSPTLHKGGIYGLVGLGLLGLVALVLTRLAPNTEIEPRRLLHPHEDQAERERLKAEFGVARRAQENLLPASSPQIPGFSIAALCRPARECGGDLYDFIPLANDRMGIVVADVSGKGVPAALYMTLTKGLLRSVSEENDDPGEILRIVNKHLYEVCKRKVFVTLFFGVLDPTSKTLTYSRAGHNPPVWRKQTDQSITLLKPPGIGLGLNSGKSFDRVLAVEKINLDPNDLLIFYSDGITEAMNEHQEEYGEERLMEVATITDGMGAEESLSAIIANVSNFLGKMLPQDDQTLVVVRVT
ncbi:MAG: SpoIIE family protein phosphatase [Acidobacteria bacterium]|nr:SpoIIE family protein phosphatase [Acidobacteriota bacterium]